MAACLGEAPRGGKMTATAEILLRSGFGVNRKGLQDVVVGLLCGKVTRKMAGRTAGEQSEHEDCRDRKHEERVTTGV